MKILNRYTKEIIFEDKEETLRDTVINALGKSVSLFQADLRNAKLADLNIQTDFTLNADFREADLNGVSFDRSDIRGTNFRGADLSGVSFDRARLAGIDLRDSVLVSTTFDYADFDGAGPLKINTDQKEEMLSRFHIAVYNK